MKTWWILRKQQQITLASCLWSILLCDYLKKTAKEVYTKFVFLTARRPRQQQTRIPSGKHINMKTVVYIWTSKLCIEKLKETISHTLATACRPESAVPLWACLSANIIIKHGKEGESSLAMKWVAGKSSLKKYIRSSQKDHK